MLHLGGGSLFLGKDVGWGHRESIADFANVLSQYVDVVVCRAHAHQILESLAEHCGVPVINGLTDLAHPCQALADVYTLRELNPRLTEHKLAFVGDANNMARSLAVACARLDIEFSIASPDGYRFQPDFVQQLTEASPKMRLTQTGDPIEAVSGATAIYTDVWASMGQEEEREQRKRDFAPYQVTKELLEHAGKGACFLHCLPARRGEEVTEEVIDGPSSEVFRQASNRMHVQKGLLAWLLAAQN